MQNDIFPEIVTLFEIM